MILQLEYRGFGVCYKARHNVTNRIVAIKKIPIPNINIKNIAKEAKFLGECKHENIVDIMDCFIENDTAYVIFLNLCEM